MHRTTTKIRAGLLVVGVGALLALSAGCRDREQRAYGTMRPAEGEPNARAPMAEPSEPKNAEPDTPKMPPSGGAMAFLDMKMKLAEAKCERAVRCDQVGKGKTWGSKEACIGETKADEFPGLSAAQECPHGVDAKDVAKCANDIKASACDEALAQSCNDFLCVGAPAR